MEEPAAPAERPGRGWRGRPPRDVLLLLAGAAALLIAFWLVVRLRSLLVMLLISFFLSFALEPPVNRLARLGWRRGLGTAAVFAAIAVAVLGFVAVLGSLLVSQVGALVDAIPGYVQEVTDFLNDRLGTRLSGAELAEQVRGNQGVRDFVNGLAAGAVGLSTTLVGYVYSRALLAACSAVATTLFLALTGALLALPAAACVQALVLIYLHRYEVIADPLTRTPYPARRAP